MKSEMSLPPDYFERVYAANPDPWGYETSDYEDRKYATTLAALPRDCYACGLEIGCSVGVLTERLARRCEHLLAIDVNGRALARARERSALRQNVEFDQMQVPQSFPTGTFDLIVVSEIGYYWSRDDLALAASRILGALRDHGSLLLVHWTDPVHDYPLTGDDVHEHFMQLVGDGLLGHVLCERKPRYRLDLFSGVIRR
jgi:SAM-dependent methyltransferase